MSQREGTYERSLTSLLIDSPKKTTLGFIWFATEVERFLRQHPGLGSIASEQRRVDSLSPRTAYNGVQQSRRRTCLEGRPSEEKREAEGSSMPPLCAPPNKENSTLTSPSGFVAGIVPVRSASSAKAFQDGFSSLSRSWYASRETVWPFLQWTRWSVPCRSSTLVDVSVFE